MKAFIQVVFILLMSASGVLAQRVPSFAENIAYLVSFGQDTPTSWGDDDNCQIYFISVAKSYNRPFYIRVFDADLGGQHDVNAGGFNTKTRFRVIGGKGAYSNEAARGVDPKPGYDEGITVYDKSFGVEPALDNNWLTIGPLNPRGGEYDESLGSYIFKLIVEGEKGNDGNLFYFQLSTNPTSNLDVPGSNAFCYEITFRVPQNKQTIPHLYPFVDDDVKSVRVHNFDFDNGGGLRLTSTAKNNHIIKSSGDASWSMSEFDVISRERQTSYDIHILDAAGFNNDMTMFVTNQYDEVLPFFSKPINGIPRYKYKLGINIEPVE